MSHENVYGSAEETTQIEMFVKTEWTWKYALGQVYGQG